MSQQNLSDKQSLDSDQLKFYSMGFSLGLLLFLSY
jgi:hypothetical protein